MATSLYIGSDETFLHVCDICLEDDRNVEAVALCSVCDQYFCVTCKTVHERSKVSREHGLVTGDNLSTKSVTFSSKISCKEHGPNEEVKYFCLVHEVPCCKKCKLIDHRGCKKMESLINVAAQRNPKEGGQQLLQKSQCLEAEIESLNSAFETNLNKLEEQQVSMVEAIHDQRRRLDTVLDEWETKYVKEVKDTFVKESRVLNDNMSICSEVALEVKTNITKMQHALKETDEECFIKMTEVQKDKSKYNDIFREMHKVSCKIEMKLEKEDIAETIQSQLKDSNKIDVRYYKDKNSLPSFSTRPYKDRVALDAGEVNICLQSDVKTPRISGIEVMHGQDNKILFCDFDNHKLKLLDVDNGSWTENTCSSTPWRISKTDVTNEVITTLPDENCLQLFHINETGHITIDEKLQQKKKIPIYHINKHQNNYITQSSSSLGWTFEFISKNGKPIGNIRNESQQSKLFKCTTYQTVDTNADILYITDGKYGCIGLSMTGDVVFRYNDKLVKEYKGVTTDPDGNVYLSGMKSNNVVMVNNKGETIKVLLDGLDKPRFIKYDEPTNSLIVHIIGSNVVKMFHLM